MYKVEVSVFHEEYGASLNCGGVEELEAQDVYVAGVKNGKMMLGG